VSTKRKEAHERANIKLQQRADTYEVVMAEEKARLENIRQRTVELRAQRLAQEARGRKIKKVNNARVARPATTLADWLDTQQKTGRKT
jgi:hypothetical protein